MPERGNGDLPLPKGWEKAIAFDGKCFFIDHINRRTTWIDPRDRFTKPQTFADCVGDELPLGWEEVHDPNVGVYYIDHISQINQLEDPRVQWRQEQEHMLKEYLVTAQEDLDAKKEIYSIKEQRLLLAQDEFQHLNDTLTGWKSSRTSLNSNSSVGSTKYDPDLLKQDVNLARSRVARLKQELEQIGAEMTYKERGVETLSSVGQKLSTISGGYSLEQAQRILSEIRQLQSRLSQGEKEKNNLMQCLARLKEDLMKRASGSSPDVSTLSLAQERLDMASQTDLRGEFGLNQSRLLAEKTRMRLQYDEAQRRLGELKCRLAKIEDRMVPGQPESDKDRLLLIQEKEQLLRELRSIDPKGRSEAEMLPVKERISELEGDLLYATKISNKQIQQRISLHDEKATIIHQLKETTKLTSYLESQLRSLSLSTLSVSSGSSLGSLGSLSAGSRGSLNSLTTMDIYSSGQMAGSAGEINLPELHQRVEKLLQGHSMSPIQEAQVTEAATSSYMQSVLGSSQELSDPNGNNSSNNNNNNNSNNLSNSNNNLPGMLSSSNSSLINSGLMGVAGLPQKTSMSPKSSITSSASPPVSPMYGFGPPPSYEQHMNALEQRQVPSMQQVLHSQHPHAQQAASGSTSSMVTVTTCITTTTAAAVTTHSAVDGDLSALSSHVSNSLTNLNSSFDQSKFFAEVFSSQTKPTNVVIEDRGFNTDNVSFPMTGVSSVVSSASGGAGISVPNVSGDVLESANPGLSALDLGAFLGNVCENTGSASLVQASQDAMLLPTPDAAQATIGSSPGVVPPLSAPPQSSTLPPPVVSTWLSLMPTITSQQIYLQAPKSLPTDIGPEAPPPYGGGAPPMQVAACGSRQAASMEPILNPPLSPISESSSGVGNNLSGGNTRSVSAAVSDESVAGDSGVFEASVRRTGHIDKVLESTLESAQIQIKLKYEGLDRQLLVGIEQARNLQVLPFARDSCVCIKAALLPNQTVCWETEPMSELKSPKFSKVFRIAIPECKLLSRTLQVHVWSISAEKGEECLGCSQVSLADFDPKSVSVRWYNVLSFRFMQSDLKGKSSSVSSSKWSSGQSQPSSSSSSEGVKPLYTHARVKQKQSHDQVHQLLEASSAKLRQSAATSSTSDDQSSGNDSVTEKRSQPPMPVIVSLKEESSDESTIISSQTSTLTRNHGPEDMKHHQSDSPHAHEGGDDNEDDDEEDDDYDDAKDDFAHMIQEVLNELADSVDYYDNAEFTESEDGLMIVTCDQSTNTEAGDYTLKEVKRRGSHHHHHQQQQHYPNTLRSSTIRRSQTFSPACRQQHPGYVCKLNRSDSDSSMPLYRRTPFQRNTVNRRSLRWKRPDGTIGMMPLNSHIPFRTSLDLELDLQASHTRLSHLRDEITRLRELKNTLEESKNKGEWELPSWLSENEKFHRLLSMAEKLYQTSGSERKYMSKQDRRAEHLMKKVTKDVQRMRFGTQQSRLLTFREKMAFFTNTNMDVPVIPSELTQPTTDLRKTSRSESRGDDRLSSFNAAPLMTSTTTLSSSTATASSSLTSLSSSSSSLVQVSNNSDAQIQGQGTSTVHENNCLLPYSSVEPSSSIPRPVSNEVIGLLDMAAASKQSSTIPSADILHGWSENPEICDGDGTWPIPTTAVGFPSHISTNLDRSVGFVNHNAVDTNRNYDLSSRARVQYENQNLSPSSVNTSLQNSSGMSGWLGREKSEKVMTGLVFVPPTADGHTDAMKDPQGNSEKPLGRFFQDSRIGEEV